MTHVFQAALWMSGAIGAFCVMAICGRLVGQELDTFEIMLFRSLIGFAIVCIFLYFSKGWKSITFDQMPSHLWRNISHFIGQNMWFYAITVIPLAQVFALEFTSPLWVILLGPFLLSEAITPLRLLSALIGFIGILIVTRPFAHGFDIGLIFAAVAAFFFALTNIFTKRLTRKQSISCILFFLTLIQIILGAICAGIDADIALPSLQTLPLIVLIGIAGLLAHLCLTNALSLAPATIVIPMDFIRLPVISVIGMIYFAESLDYWVFIGGIIIFAGNYLNIWQESKANKKMGA